MARMDLHQIRGTGKIGSLSSNCDMDKAGSLKVEFHRLDFALLSEDINPKTFRVVIPAPLSSRGPCVERHHASP